VTIVFVVGFFGLLALGVPYLFALAVPALIAVLAGVYPTSLLIHRTMIGIDNFLLIAIPMFILAGNVMERGDISRRLIALAGALLRRFRSGLPNSLVLGEMFFSGISGSTVADISAMSAMVVPAMEKTGYRRSYSLAVVAAASAFGILIPPCILMIVTAALLNSSVFAVFLAAALPTAVFAILTMGLVYWQAGAREPDAAAASPEGPGVWRALVDSAWALGLPVIIVLGTVFGVATPTEIAVVAALYAFFVTLVIYRTLELREIPAILVDTAVTTGALCLTFGFATVITYFLARQEVPAAISQWALATFHSPEALIVAFAFVFMILGSLLEGLPAALILVPILWPAAQSLGVDVVHFQIVIVAAIGIGLFLPPVGLGLVIAAQVGRERIEAITRDFLPFLVVLIVGLVVVCVFPWLSTVTPRFFGVRS
jgi:tripartite ATP-independent transporter DctM subunit